MQHFLNALLYDNTLKYIKKKSWYYVESPWNKYVYKWYISMHFHFIICIVFTGSDVSLCRCIINNIDCTSTKIHFRCKWDYKKKILSINIYNNSKLVSKLSVWHSSECQNWRDCVWFLFFWLPIGRNHRFLFCFRYVTIPSSSFKGRQ